MVEMAVIETASENRSSQLSTNIVYLLSFPAGGAGKQALPVSSPLIHDALQDPHAFTFTAE